MIGQLLTGRYLIVKTLGAGGFSDTYLARDKYLPHHPLCVVKCLKLSSSSTISPETARRLFETEARLLDQLGQYHDQIPTLFAYCQEQDQVYQVQEYIDGENLGSRIAQGRCLTSDEAIALLLEVLPILDFIHSYKLVHRDIKPSNLIRRQQDGKVVLIDFGAACLLSDRESSSSRSSHDNPLIIGTPGYMPSEQHDGKAQLNSDLYALGMSIIHLLTGVHPQKFQLDPISGELDWQRYCSNQVISLQLAAVLHRMVRNRPRDRYQHATEAISALQSQSTVKGRPARKRRKSKRKQPIQRFLKTALLAGVIASGIGGGWYIHTANGQPQALLQHFAMLSDPPNLHLKLLGKVALSRAIDHMMIAPNNHLLVTAGTDHVLRLWSLPHNKVEQSLKGHTDTVTALNMNQASTLLVSGSKDRTVRLWDVASGKLLQTFRGHDDAITAVAISPDGHTVVSGSKDKTLRIWNLQTGTLSKTLTLPKSEITAVIYGTTPQRLISASGDRQLQVWDLRTGQLKRTFAGHTASIVGLQMVDDHTLFSFGDDRTLVWDLDRETLVHVCSDDTAKPLVASSSNQHLISVHDDGNLRLWGYQSGQLVAQGTHTLGRSLDVALSPNHHYLVSSRPDQQLEIWQMNTDNSARRF